MLDGPRQSFTISAPTTNCCPAPVILPIIVAYRNGAPVRLTDVATVIDSAENVQQAAWMNTTPAVIAQHSTPARREHHWCGRPHQAAPAATSAFAAVFSKGSVLTDRTQTIRASVNDVQFEMMLTIALVVMVMFLFLRNLSATVIPSVAVPLSLVGTFGVMYLLGYSLDNLSLMALTISTGFVVDDAIVMIENIVALPRGRRIAAGGGAERLRADRLHHRFADRIADRGAHPAAVHGRHRRPPLPRVRDHAGRHDPDFGRGLAHPDADDVRQAAEAQAGVAAGPLLHGLRTLLRARDRLLRTHIASACSGISQRR